MRRIVVLAITGLLSVAATSAHASTLITATSITTNTTWGPTGSPADSSYLINPTGVQALTILSGATLTIQPGTTLYFAVGKGLQVGGATAGSFIALGTPTERILFSSSNGTRGGWTSLDFADYSDLSGAASSLAYCTIKGGGAGGYQVRVTNSNGVTLSNCDIAEHTNIGLVLNNAKPVVSQCAFRDRDAATYAFSGAIGDIASLFGQSTCLPRPDGKYNAALIVGGTVSTSVTLSRPPAGFCYITDGGALEVRGASNPVLTIADGTLVKMVSGQYLRMGYSGAGGLRAKGVVFTSSQDDTLGDTNGNGASTGAANQWRNLRFEGGTLAGQTVLDSCVVRFGGDTDGYGVLVQGSQPTLTRCVIDRNLGYGLRVEGTSTGLEISGNVLRGNSTYEISAPPWAMVNLVPNNTVEASGDGKYNGYHLQGVTIATSMTLPKPPAGFCYITDGNPLDVRGAGNPVLTIADGTLIKMVSSYIQVGYGQPGGLIAHGVLFTSSYDDTLGDTNGNATAAAPGQWRGILIEGQAIDAQTVLDSCVVRFAGIFYSCGVRVTDANPIIRGCRIASTSGSGLLVVSGAPTVTGSTFTSNTTGISCTGASSTPNIASCALVGNSTGGLDVTSGATPQLSRSNVYQNGSFGVRNQSSSVTIFAGNNWWGAPSGPSDQSSGPPDYNPSGTGNVVSDYVTYRPWATSEFALDAPSPGGRIPWASAAGGAWSNGANWAGGFVPGYQDTAVIDLGGDYAVTLDMSISIGSLAVGAQAGTQTLSISGKVVTLGGPAAVSPNGAIALTNGSILGIGPLSSAGTLTIQNGTLGVPTENLGLLVFRGSCATVGGLENQSSGRLILEGTPTYGGGQLRNGSGITNRGALELASSNNTQAVDEKIYEDAPGPMLLNDTGGIISLLPGSAGNGGRWLSTRLDNRGTLRVDYPGNIAAASASHVNSGAIEVNANLSVSQSGTSPSFSNSGTITVGSGRTLAVTGATFLNAAGGNIRGTGSLNVSSCTFTNSGNVNPGPLPGVFRVVGNLNQSSSGALNLEIGGPTTGVDYDQLSVTGTAALGGTINVVTSGGYVPGFGTVFKVLTYGSRTGVFGHFNGWQIGANTILDATYGAGDLSLTAKSVCAGLQVAGVAPAKGGNTGTVTVTIRGCGLASGSTARLVSAGDPDIGSDTTVVAPDQTSLLARFTLSGAAPGLRDLVVTAAGSGTVTLPGAFAVEDGGRPDLWVQMLGPSLVRAGRQATYQLLLGNRGTVDGGAVPVWIDGIPAHSSWQLQPAISRAAEDTPYPMEVYGAPTQFALPLIVGSIGPGETRTIFLTLGPSSAGMLQAWVGVPWAWPAGLASTSESPTGIEASQEWMDCLEGVAGDAAAAVLPAGGCLKSSLEAILFPFAAQLEGLSSANPIVLSDQLDLLKKGIASCTIDALTLNAARIAEAANASKAVITGVKSGIDLYRGSKLVGGTIAHLTSGSCKAVLTSPVQSSLSFGLVSSWDPNDILGPVGVGASRLVSPTRPLTYSIHFENLDSATAAAQEVVIRDALDTTKFELGSVSFGDIEVGGRHIALNEAPSGFRQDVDLRPATNLILRFAGDVDSTAGAVTWTLTSLDPETAQMPADPLAGFLPPNVSPPNGEGSVTFSVMPKQTLVTGNEVRNQASIVFDANPAILTPVWNNIVDSDRPVSQVQSITALQDEWGYDIHWQGSDVGAGVATYDVYVSRNGGPYTEWLHGAEGPSAVFSPDTSGTYAFYSLAHDLVGNVEDAPVSADVTVTVSGVPPTPVVPEFATGVEGSSLSIEVSAYDSDGDPIDSLTVDLSRLPAGNGATFAVTPSHNAGTFHWSPKIGEQGDYVLRFRAIGNVSRSDSCHLHIRSRWKVGGVDADTTGSKELPQITADGLGGGIVAWVDHRNGSADIYAQRVDAGGGTVWGRGGVPVCTAPGDQVFTAGADSSTDGQRIPQMVSDGLGGAILAWTDYRGADADIYAQRVDVLGRTQWDSTGVKVCTATGIQGPPRLASDGRGGAILVWEDSRPTAVGETDLYAQRIDISGLPLWPTDGVCVSNAPGAQRYPVIAPDDSGGAVVSWSDTRGGDSDVYAERISLTGTLLWPPLGAPMAVGAGEQTMPQVVQDVGGSFLVWYSDTPAPEFRAQRLGPTGQPRWDPAGVRLPVAGAARRGTNAVTDGNRGLIVTWSDGGGGSSGFNLSAQRVDSTGAVAWSGGKGAICSAVGDQFLAHGVADGTGGLVVAWEDRRAASPSIYAQRISDKGNPHWSADGLLVGGATGSHIYPFVSGDGLGGCLIAWQERRPGNDQVYVMRVAPEGGTFITSVDAPGAPPAAFRLLPNFPNPFNPSTRIRFEVPRSIHARLGVFDVQGRLVQWLVDGPVGAGLHEVSWHGRDKSGVALASGVYFYRLEAGQHSASGRMVLLK